LSQKIFKSRLESIHCNNVKLTGSDNKAISLTKIKTVTKGGLSLGGTMFPLWVSESEGIYQEMGTQYIETYTSDIPAGDMKLGIMPQNTQQFEYIITMGSKWVSLPFIFGG
jgi:hypothetical protein